MFRDDLLYPEHIKYNNSPRFIVYFMLLSEIVKIYDQTFARFGLKISTDKTETMAFNADEEIKSRPSLISNGDDALKNVLLNTLGI